MRLQANGIGIEVDDRGPPGAPPILLVMGLGMQLTGWPDELVDLLLQRGYRVIRFDNRDVGLSEGFDHRGVPNLTVAALRYLLRLRVHAPYTLADMADDAVGVLDALGIASAHVCGASMGGMIAQQMAVRHPQRVRSLLLMMTSSGARRLPQARPQVRRALLSRPKSGDKAAAEAHLVRLFHLIGSPGYPPDPERLRQRIHDSVARAWRPAGTTRQLVAVVADGDRTPLLGRIAAPTCVVHGRDDPLIPVAAAHDLVVHIPDSTVDIVPGMGHDLPLALLPRLAGAIVGNAGRGVV